MIKGYELVELLKVGKINLRDSLLVGIRFYTEEDKTFVELILRKNDSSEFLILEFYDILEYQFYYESSFLLYIEDYKIIHEEGGGCYLSLDPDPETSHKSNEDGDIIIAKGIVMKSFPNWSKS